MLEIENQNIMEEVETLRERQSVLAQLSSSSHEVLVKSKKCDQRDILKNENKYSERKLEIFIK